MTSKNASVEMQIRFSLIEKSRSAEYIADFPFYVDGLVRGEPGGFVLTPSYASVADKFLNIPLRSDDVWVITFPKCGNSNRHQHSRQAIFVSFQSNNCIRDNLDTRNGVDDHS